MKSSFLTRSEKRVKKYICDGLTNKRIAKVLGVTEQTVKLHCTNIYAKSKVRSRSELMAQEGKVTKEELVILRDIIFGERNAKV